MVGALLLAGLPGCQQGPLPAVRQSPVADIVNDRPVLTTGSTFDGPTNTTWTGQP